MCVQVVCGLHFTLALDCHGRVMQMGRMGVGSSKGKESSALWEGALAPVVVEGQLRGGS